MFYWVVALAVPNSKRKYFEIFSWMGIGLNLFLTKALNLNCMADFIEISKKPFDFPIKIKAAGIIGIVMCTANCLVVISI